MQRILQYRLRIRDWKTFATPTLTNNDASLEESSDLDTPKA